MKICTASKMVLGLPFYVGFILASDVIIIALGKKCFEEKSTILYNKQNPINLVCKSTNQTSNQKNNFMHPWHIENSSSSALWLLLRPFVALDPRAPPVAQSVPPG